MNLLNRLCTLSIEPSAGFHFPKWDASGSIKDVVSVATLWGQMTFLQLLCPEATSSTTYLTDWSSLQQFLSQSFMKQISIMGCGLASSRECHAPFSRL